MRPAITFSLLYPDNIINSAFNAHPPCLQLDGKSFAGCFFIKLYGERRPAGTDYGWVTTWPFRVALLQESTFTHT